MLLQTAYLDGHPFAGLNPPMVFAYPPVPALLEALRNVPVTRARAAYFTPLPMKGRATENILTWNSESTRTTHLPTVFLIQDMGGRDLSASPTRIPVSLTSQREMYYFTLGT